MLKCIKCRKEIPEGSLYCNHCGKKQTATKSRTHKRAHGTGTIAIDKRYSKPYIAYAPSVSRSKRTYIGTFATRKEAQDALEKFVREGKPELYNATLEKVYNLWSETHYKQISENSVKLYKTMWKKFETIQHMKMQDIRTAHFQEIVNTGKSAAACHAIRSLASMLSSCAMENDIIQKNYAEFIKMPKFEKKEKQIFSTEDIQKLWEHSGEKPVQIILFMIYTGFRIGEVLALKQDNLHLEEGYIVGGEKTEAGKNRIVPLPPNIPELKAFLSSWTIAEDGRLFPMSQNTFRKEVFYPALKLCGIETKLTPHSTRHTFASLCADAGMQPEKLQKIIGHASYQTTADVYIHQDIDALKKAMEKLRK